MPSSLFDSTVCNRTPSTTTALSMVWGYSIFHPLPKRRYENSFCRRWRKSSPTDFVSTNLKACSNVFDSVIARLANLTFSEEPGLDPEDPASYKPISNLNSIGEGSRAVVSFTISSSCVRSLFLLLSAYRPHHYTETTFLKILNDIFEATDARKATVLVALDLLAAFDMIDQSVLINRLNTRSATVHWLANGSVSISAFIKSVEKDLGRLL